MRRLWMKLGLAALLGLYATDARAGDEPIDTVVLLDASSAMQQTDALDGMRKLLTDLVPHMARPGAQVALIPFGNGAHKATVVRVPHDSKGAAEARSKLHEALAGTRARDQHRYLYAAVERGLDQLREFKERHPRRERRMIVVSMGARDVPDSEPEKKLAQRIAGHEGPGMVIGRDWTLWYGHFKGGDEQLRRFIEDRGVGTSIALDRITGDRWGSVHVDWPVIQLGRQKVGEWKQKITFEAKGPVGTVLNLRAGLGPNASGATVTVIPSTVQLREKRQKFTVSLSGYARKGSNYHGAWIRCDAVGSRPIWTTGSRTALLSGASRASVRFELEAIDFERVDRGTKVTRRFKLVANEEAKQRRCELRFEAVDLPPDVSLKVEPAVVRLDELDRIKLVLSAYPGSRPGAFESRLVLKPSAGLRVEQREIAVRYEVGRGGVRVLQAKLVAPPLVRGGDVIATLTLVPDEGAVEAGARISIRVGELPEGLQVEVPRRFMLHEETELQVRLRSSAGTPDGVLRTTLHLSALGEIRVVPEVIPVEVQIVPPPPIKVVGEIQAGRKFATRAESIAFELPVEVGRVHHGTLLEFIPLANGYEVNPPRARLVEGAQKINLSINPSRVEAGPASVNLRVFSIRAGERRLAGTCSVRWTVSPSFVRVIDWRGPPPLSVNGNLVTAKLEFEASPDLKGRDLDLVTNFGSLPHGAEFAAGLDSVKIQGGEQSVTVPIDIVRDLPGQFPGFIELELADPNVDTAQLRPLPFTIDIPEPPLGTSLLDPAKQRKMIYLAGALVLIFFAFALLFRILRRRSRRRVEFVVPEKGDGKEPDPEAFREYEFWSAYQDEKF